MSTSVGERSPDTGEELAPDWAPVPQEKPVSRSAVLARALGRAAVAFAFAAVLWWLGHRVPALALAGLMATLTVASLLVPAVAAAIDRGVRVVQRTAGRVLGVVLLGGVGLLVFTPLAVLLRLLGRDPLALGSSPQDASFWRPYRSAPSPLYERPFAYERALGEPDDVRADRLPLPRLRGVLGLLALLLLLDVGLGVGAAAVRSLTADDSPTPTEGGLVAQDLPAGAGEPWRLPLGHEINRIWESKRYDPYLGWNSPDFDGRHVNVSGGARRTYAPAGGAGAGAVTVFFFGGSTMFGLYQRDEHTIPSEVARLAEADGIRVRAVNYGRLAYVNWQEGLLFQRLVSQGRRPDLAVFYDGFNELLSQFQDGPHSRPSHIEARDFEARLPLGDAQQEDDEPAPTTALYEAWADVSAVHRVGRLLGVVSEPGPRTVVRRSIWEGDQADRPGRRGALAASIYSRGVEVNRRLARSYGIGTAFFWQPFLYSKRTVPGEAKVRRWLGTDPESWAEADRVARGRLPGPAQDLSTALDAVDEPVLYDFVHTNELGARVMAREIYRRLRPSLRELSAAARG